MATVNLEDDDNELGFGEEFYVSFEVNVSYTIEPYTPANWYGPAEGGDIEINGYDFKMFIKPVDSNKNKLLDSFFNYDTLNEEKKKEINNWISDKLESDSVQETLYELAWE